MSGRWAVEMAEALRIGDKAGGPMFAQVRSTAPLTILAHDQTISKNLYISPALLTWADGGGGRITEDLKELAPHSYQFLSEFHQQYVLKEGDTVIAFQVGAAFYIMGKVVKV